MYEPPFKNYQDDGPRITKFELFYLLFLLRRRTYSNRVVHFLGVLVSFFVMLTGILEYWEWKWLYVPATIYGFGFFGDWFFERKRFFKIRYPIWGFLASYKFFFDVVKGKRSFTCYEHRRDIISFLSRR